MISCDFAPNESWDDAWISFKLLFQPWRWRSGKETELVKEKIAQLLNVSRYKLHVTSFLTGRTALYFLLKSFRLPPRSQIIVQAFTCEAAVLPILANNLKPVYIDIESDTFSINYRELTNRLTDNCRVLILQHTFGLTPKYRKQILELAKEKGLIVIEDLAHGFSQEVFSSSSFHLPSSHFYLLSFGRSKSISSVFGGAIISLSNLAIQQFNNLSYPSSWFIFKCLLYKPLALLIKSTYDFYVGKIMHRITSVFGLLTHEITPKEKNGEYDDTFNKAYPNALALLLLHQLKKLEQKQKNRAKIVNFYRKYLKNVTGYRLQVTNQPLLRYPVLVNNRDELVDKARKQNIFFGTWYDQPVAPKDLNLKRVGYRIGSCPKAEEICKQIVNLPLDVSKPEAMRLVDILNDVTKLC